MKEIDELKDARQSLATATEAQKRARRTLNITIGALEKGLAVNFEGWTFCVHSLDDIIEISAWHRELFSAYCIEFILRADKTLLVSGLGQYTQKQADELAKEIESEINK